MKHKLLTTATLLLFVLLTWSCTNDDEPVMTTPPAITTPDASALSITIGPRPQFAIGSNQPATRAIQTPDGTAAQWETGDVLWLYVHFSWIPEGKTEADKEYKNYVSALRYDGTEWRQLSEEDCTELNTSSIKPYIDPYSSKEHSYSGFVSNPRWPAEAFAEGVTDAEVRVTARYLGKGIPDKDGILSFLDYNTDNMYAGTTAPIGTPIKLNLEHSNTRLHITDEATLKCTRIWCFDKWKLSSGTPANIAFISELSVPKGGSYYFVNIESDAELTLDGYIYTLAPGWIDGNGYNFYKGYTYTLTPLKNGTVKPGE